MNQHHKSLFLIRFGLILIFCLLFVYLFPMIRNINFSFSALDSLKMDYDGLKSALIRSCLFALLTSFVIILLSLLISIFLIKVEIFSLPGRYLSLLLIPVLLGTVSSAFIWKLLLIDSTYFFERSNRTFLALFTMEFWQYGTLFIYLFWLNMQSIKKETLIYAQAIKMSPFAKFKDVILPHQKNLSILLFVICFIFCFYEEAKIEFIFKASRGTNTELINHWLNRKYHADSLLSSDYAFNQAVNNGLLVIFIALLILLLALIFKVSSYNLFLKSKNLYASFKLKLKQWQSNLLVFLLSLLVIIPILTLLVIQSGNVKFEFVNLLFPLGLTFIAALLSTLISVSFAIMSRLVWKKTLASFNFKSMSFLVFLFILLIIPPILILISGFKWMQIIGYSANNIVITWVVGHIILSFPLLTGLSLSTHFRAKNSYMEYIEGHSIGFFVQIKDIFIKPFKADYLLTFIISYAIIWNESIINNVLSDFIPSFVTELNKTIVGKAVDYANGMNYFFISLFLALLCVGTWSYIISKSKPN